MPINTITQLEALNIIGSRIITIFAGEYGRCKSLSLAFLAHEISILTKRCNIVSNMPLRYTKHKHITVKPLLSTSQFDLDKLSLSNNSIFVWDEIFNDLKSRSPMSEQNKYIPQMGVGFRKDNIRLLGSLQFADTLDKLVGDMLEMIIIPTFVNTYSKQSSEDAKLRIQNKDFWVYWDCTDKKTGEKFRTQFNLYDFLNQYNTKFKPYRLIVDHKEYLDNMELKSRKRFDNYLDKIRIERDISLSNWQTGLQEIV